MALSLQLLGAPVVCHEGQIIRFRSRKELALLIYLAVAGGPHQREALPALFWPDSDRAGGLASLRNALARVRRALGGAGAYLCVEPRVVSLADGCPLELDLHLVDAALQADPPAPQRAGPEDLPRLLAAVSAYRGEFLEGFSLAGAPAFDDWAGQQREAWHRRLERLFNRLSRLQLEQGQVEQAIETAQRWIAHSPLHEAAYRRLMHLQFLGGDRAAALHVFERCASVLAAELGVRPDPATLALAERMRDAAPPTGPEAAPQPVRLSAELPFVGRAAEHDLLVTAYASAAQGKPQAACLVGEAGIGKTRLAQAFLAWAAVQQADLLTGRTFEAGGTLPYQALVGALRERLARENAPADLLADVWLAELTQILPELRERYPDLSPPTADEPALARSHLYEAVAQLCLALSHRRPVVLWIDDLQWADAATLDLLPYLCRRCAEGGARLLLLVALRPEAPAATAGLRECLAQVGREVHLVRLQLGPLTAEATGQVVHALAVPSAAPQAAPRRFGAWLHAETSGQPYFMAEMVKMLVEREILRVTRRGDGRVAVDFAEAMARIHGQGVLPVPSTVREVILTRLGRVSETARALLVAGAVLGRASGFEQLCQVAAVDELGGLPALDELVTSRLIVEATDGRRPYGVAHDKIRDVVYTEAGDARRRLYHRRAFQMLQAEAAPAAELAHHALAAGLQGPAFRYSVAAGEQAAGVYAFIEAAGHYRRALGIAEAEQGENPARADETGQDLTRLYLQLGRTLELSARHEQALATYDAMGRVAQARGDRAMELAALLARIMPLSTVTAVFDPAQAERLAEQALHLARELDDEVAEADILWHQLNIYRVTSRLPRAAACGQRALALARRLDRRERLTFVLQDLGYCSALMADFEPARAYFREAGALWRASGNLPMLADSLVGTCLACVFNGDYDAAIAAFEEALHISRTIGTVWALAACRHNIGYVFSDRGEVERAVSEMGEGIRLSEEAGFLSPQVVAQADLATLYGALGAVERGLQAARRAVEIAETRLPVLRVYPLAALAHLCLIQGAHAEAERLVDQMTTDPNRDGWGILPTLVLLAQSELALAQGAPAPAGDLAEQALAAARRIGARTFYPSALDLQAQAWLGLGRPHEARARWTEACHEAEALGARRRLWPILLALSRLEDDQGAADRLRKQARAVVAGMAAQTPTDLRATFLDLPAVRTVLYDSGT